MSTRIARVLLPRGSAGRGDQALRLDGTAPLVGLSDDRRPGGVRQHLGERPGPLEHMHDISSRLVVNKAAWKMKHATVQALVEHARRERRSGRGAGSHLIQHGIEQWQIFAN